MLDGLIAGSGLILAGTGALWGITAAAASGRLARNGWAGIRIGSTMASDEAWLAGHRAALPASRATGIGALVMGLALMVNAVVADDDDGSVGFWVLFALGYGGVLVGAFFIALRAHRASRATERPEEA